MFVPTQPAGDTGRITALLPKVPNPPHHNSNNNNNNNNSGNSDTGPKNNNINDKKIVLCLDRSKQGQHQKRDKVSAATAVATTNLFDSLTTGILDEKNNIVVAVSPPPPDLSLFFEDDGKGNNYNYNNNNNNHNNQGDDISLNLAMEDSSDDPFNESGGDFFDRFMSDYGDNSNSNANHSNNNLSMNLGDSHAMLESILGSNKEGGGGGGAGAGADSISANNASNFFNKMNDSLDAQKLLEADLHQSTDSFDIPMDDDDDIMGSNSANNNNNNASVISIPPIGTTSDTNGLDGTNNQGGGGGGGMARTPSFHPIDTSASAAVTAAAASQKQRPWSGLTSATNNTPATAQNATFGNFNNNLNNNGNMMMASALNSNNGNATFGAKPLNVSLLGLKGSIHGKKASALPKGRGSSVVKANMTASKLRSTMSDGMLARALKAKYNTPGGGGGGGGGASGGMSAAYNHASKGMLSAKIPRNAMSSISMARGGPRGGSAATSNAVLTANTSMIMNRLKQGSFVANPIDEVGEGIEADQGGGTQNASWGAPPPKRSAAVASIFSNMVNSTTQSLMSQSNTPQIGSRNTSTSDLLRQGKKSLSSSSSVHSFLRLSSKQSKTQSMLRQSSAQSLLKQTSSQSLKDMSKKVDVTPLLPPQHVSPHATSLRKRAPGSGSSSMLRQNGAASNSSTAMSSTAPSSSSSGNSNNGTNDSSDPPPMEISSLLHQSCKLYPTTDAVVESALRIDPDAVRRTVPVTSDGRKQKSKKTPEVFAYPINIALKHDASMEVLKMLIQAGPDVLVQKDGPDASCTLGIALGHGCDNKVIELILKANPQSSKVSDRRANFPLHLAVANGHALDVIKRIYVSNPKALKMRNFHSQTPLEIAQRSTLCPESVINFLQSRAYSAAETTATEIMEDGFDDILETHFQ